MGEGDGTVSLLYTPQDVGLINQEFRVYVRQRLENR